MFKMKASGEIGSPWQTPFDGLKMSDRWLLNQMLKDIYSVVLITRLFQIIHAEQSHMLSLKPTVENNSIKFSLHVKFENEQLILLSYWRIIVCHTYLFNYYSIIICVTTLKKVALLFTINAIKDQLPSISEEPGNNYVQCYSN